MTAYSSMTRELITVWNRRFARPVKARRAVLRARRLLQRQRWCQKQQSCPAFARAVVFDELANESAIASRWLAFATG